MRKYEFPQDQAIYEQGRKDVCEDIVTVLKEKLIKIEAEDEDCIDIEDHQLITGTYSGVAIAIEIVEERM